ncbi:MAG: efflux RND transporter periplasmic adaptor subunit [Planctomycetes bacterium]|nr:efflux RND transporter periplasmic adaptor subunit [Planctomycetota bacterium]
MSAFRSGLQILFVRLRFLFVFVVVGLVVGNWGFILAYVDRMTRPRGAEDAAQGDFEWFCPMHPSVVRDDPKQKCPICGMPLSKRKRGEPTRLPPGILSRLQLSPYRIRQAGVATTEVRYRALVREVRAVGTVDYDETRLAHISARVAGRVEELYVNFAGVEVHKGDPVYKLYSPDLVSAQEEYVLSLKANDTAQAPAGAPAAGATGPVAASERVSQSARDRLRLWGLTDEQLAELEKSRQAQHAVTIFSPLSGVVIEKEIHAGHYLQVGEDPYTVADLSNVWAQVEVFESDVPLLEIGQTVELVNEAFPAEPFVGTIAFVAPALQPETRTVRVRIDVPNPERKLKPGMFVSAILRVPVGRHAEVFYGC